MGGNPAMPGAVSGVLKAADVTLERHFTHISASSPAAKDWWPEIIAGPRETQLQNEKHLQLLPSIPGIDDQSCDTCADTHTHHNKDTLGHSRKSD